jgi:Mg2+ and Co2+ transporter CorA
LIIVDPPIGDTYFVDGQKDKQPHEITLDSKPFLGTYEDFLEPPKFSSDWSRLNDKSRGGMMQELVDYWERSTPASFEAKDPTIESLAYYPLKIVAAEWVKYLAVMQYCIKQYEYQGDLLPDLDKFNMDLRELQGWRRRSMNSQRKINSVIRQLKSREREHPFSLARANLRYLIEDFEVISSNIENAGRRLENMLPVVMSLVQVIDARHALAETANISRLTILALVFVPLSYISSLFSMNSQNMPGSSHFWVYFAVAVPVTLLVFLVARPPAWIVRTLRARSQASAKRRQPVSHPTFKILEKEKGIA